MSYIKTTADDVKRLAGLARIEVAEEDLPAFTAEFEAVLAYVGTLDALELADEGPSVPEVRNVLREDGVPHVSGTWTQAMIEQFPQREGDSLSVKQIISHD